ncbi:hypothetical protein PtrSN001C_006116 [Pyrenophora tritici-repentis]|nr:hypothetical protein PtrSN001C_006116 [Pyrenophora tritici-repentis]KAI1542839.1 hypothetical protein PtrSN001A_003291 [Pyrenophora tritici-repentis]KAI1600480.1 hypothetical protein PtrEW13061_000625 [Pyrenophora tritici-repentis]
MAPTSSKRKAGNELGSSPPAKRRQLKETKSTQSVSHQSSSTSRTPSLTPPRPSSASLDEGDVEEPDELLYRIQSGIEYIAQQRRRGEAIEQTTRFEINLGGAFSQAALDLLRRHATLIYSSRRFEVFELGVPRPNWVKEGGVPGVHDTQWWIGKTAAHIKAGPFAEEQDVKKAAANLKGMQTRMNKKKEMTAREREVDEKLTEGDEDENQQDRPITAPKRRRQRPVVKNSEDEDQQDRPIAAPKRRRWMPVVEDSEDEM